LASSPTPVFLERMLPLIANGTPSRPRIFCTTWLPTTNITYYSMRRVTPNAVSLIFLITYYLIVAEK
ncbi:MAG: hypothetical protein V3T23_09555, partial [Nitrososphaerales archaeon]